MVGDAHNENKWIGDLISHAFCHEDVWSSIGWSLLQNYHTSFSITTVLSHSMNTLLTTILSHSRNTMWMAAAATFCLACVADIYSPLQVFISRSNTFIVSGTYPTEHVLINDTTIFQSAGYFQMFWSECLEMLRHTLFHVRSSMFVSTLHTCLFHGHLAIIWSVRSPSDAKET